MQWSWSGWWCLDNLILMTAGPGVLTLTIISFHLHHNSPPISQLRPQLMSNDWLTVTHVNTGLSLVRAQWPEACDWSGHQDSRIPPGFRGVRASRSAQCRAVYGACVLGNEDSEDYSLIIIRCSTLWLTFQPDAGGLVPHETPCQGILILQKSVCN